MKNILLIITSIFLLTISSYSSNCCSVGQYEIYVGDGGVGNASVQSECEWVNSVVRRTNHSWQTNGSVWFYYTSDLVRCVDEDPCLNEETNTEWNEETFQCEEPPAPPCPDGQTNQGTEFDVNCVCDSGYPVYDLVTQGIVECVSPTCLPDNGSGLPLKAENITFSQCSQLYNPILGYQIDFQTVGDLTCCYSDSIQEVNDNPCEPNQVLNNDGLCQDIEQDNTNNCPTGYVWSALDDKCVLSPDPDTDTNDQSGNDDGLNSDGTIREDDEDTTYSGGGLEDNTSEKWLLEYNEDEVDDMLEKYSTGVKTEFSDILAEYSKDLFQLYTVSVPVMPTCGCENISYDMTILGKSYSDTIDICSPMNSMFEIVKPILWFFFLIGLLITYFTGRVD